MHHKPENRRAYVDNQKCSFCEVVKICNGLYHCVPLVEMVEKHIWNVQFGVRMRELCLRENICLGHRYFRSETGTSGGWRRKEKISVWATGTSGPRPELPVAGGGRRSFARK
jgi:hypothetical protein